jgi:putative membrane protein
MLFTLDPYCGTSPTPQFLMEDWNLDPFLLVSIAAIGALTWRSARKQKLVPHWSIAIALCIVAFVSPLCALSSALFSARSVHHLILISIVAPLTWSFFHESILAAAPPMAAFVVHTFLLWMWHLPMPYSWALSGSIPYWSMEVPLVLSALWLWREILDPRRAAGGALAVCGATILQMTLLGAFLTLAPRPLFSPHFLTTAPYGLSPLEDQQLAGLLMWVPASLPYVVAFLVRVGQTIKTSSCRSAG